MTQEQCQELNNLVDKIVNKIENLKSRGIYLKGLLEKVKKFSEIDDYVKCKKILEKIDSFLDELEIFFQEIDVLLQQSKSEREIRKQQLDNTNSCSL